MKRLALLAVFLLSMSVFVSAEFSKENAVQWLKSNTENKWSSLGSDIEKISFAILALEINNEEVSQGVSYLKSKGSGCYPAGNCNTKDTALAALALDSVGEDISELEDYLEGNLKSSGSGSEGLIIQIITGESGSCSFSYDNEKIYAKEINAENPWVYMNQIGISFDNYLEEIGVSCEFDSLPRISLIKESNNNFHILDEKGLTNNAQFEIESGCYSLSSDSNSCDVGSTFYASWVMHMLNSDIYTINYMRNNIGNDPLRSAMLGLIDNSELGSLVGMQSSDGSFDSVYKTSFAIDSLKNSDYSAENDNAVSYIESQQNEDGSIDDLKNTATVLYLVYRSVFTGGDGEGSSGGYCGDGTLDFDEECEYNSDCATGEQCSLQCACEPTITTNERGCGNGVCENDENSVMCPIDCVDVSDSCGNGICELSKGEDSFVCGEDCYCGDFICDDSEKTSGSCSQDCESGGSGADQESYCGDGFCDADEDQNVCAEDCGSGGSRSIWWLWLIIIIFIIGGGIFVYLKMKKGGSPKGNESNNFRVPPSKPIVQNVRGPQPRTSPNDDRLEKQLDESIKKAKELLKK